MRANKAAAKAICLNVNEGNSSKFVFCFVCFSVKKNFQYDMEV